MGTRESLAKEFGLRVDQVDEWLRRAAIDVKQVHWLPYEVELRTQYGWADVKQNEFIKALMATVRA